MNDRRQDDELRDLLLSRKEGTIAAGGIARIDELVCSDASLLRLYIEYARMFSDLRLGLTDDRINETLSMVLGGDESSHSVARNDAVDANGRRGSRHDSTTAANAPDTLRPFSPSVDPFPSPPIPILGDTFRNASGYLVSGWPVAYLVATVIFAVGLAVGALVHVSRPVDVVQHDESLSAPMRRTEGESPSNASHLAVVGRVTAMVDCQFEGSGFGVQGAGQVAGAKRSAGPPKDSLIYLGDRIALKSGLLEITYNTGAVVILQGPTTYEVESPAGGFLAIGKLTAKLEKRSAVSGQRSGMSNPQSLIPNPLFSVRTPTAVVTDLGTEFGVEVDTSGATKSHVFRGVVRVQVVAEGKPQGEGRLLRENEAVQVTRGAGATTAISRIAVGPEGFVRFEYLAKLAETANLRSQRKWQAYSRQLRNDPSLVAYYTFEAVKGVDTRHVPNLSAAGSSLDGRIEGVSWGEGRFPGKRALCFHGPGSENRVELPAASCFCFAGPFSVAVWFKADRFTTAHQHLIAKEGLAWRLQRPYERDTLVFCRDGQGTGQDSTLRAFGKSKVDDQRWHLAVGVYDSAAGTARQRLYIDGRLEDEETGPVRPLRPDDSAVWLGARRNDPDSVLRGMIDEVAILARALSAEEIGAMFQAGNPTRSPDRSE